MEERITLCGDDCMAFPRYHAHSEAELREAAELWYRVGWRDTMVSNEKIAYTGCSSHKNCTYGLVECIREHGIEKCNRCKELVCDKIKDIKKVILRNSCLK